MDATVWRDGDELIQRTGGELSDLSADVDVLAALRRSCRFEGLDADESRLWGLRGGGGNFGVVTDTLRNCFRGALVADIASVRAVSEAPAPLSMPGRNVNFAADGQTDGVRGAYRDDIYTRLARLKREHDPGNLFHRNQNVQPGQ